MEENIFEIIKDHEHDFQYGVESPQRDIAKEISVHVKKFIKWKDNQDIIKIYDDPDVYINLDDYKLMSLDEVFKHWLDNVKNK